MKKSIFILIFFTCFLLLSSIVYALSLKNIVPLDLLSSFFSSILGTTTPTPVYINSNKVIGTNKLSLGFVLDGPDINKWRASSILQQQAKDANFKMVRFFEHRMGKICTDWNVTTKNCNNWNWANIDDLVSKIYSIGAEPLIGLGFYSFLDTGNNRISSVPTNMPINSTTSELPNHFGLVETAHWAAYCREFAKHFKAKGYPIKYYEIINEPYHYFDWVNKTKLGYYMELYNACAKAMREVDPNIQLGNDASTMKEVLDYFISKGENLDFISYHGYATGDYNAPDSLIINAAETKYINQAGSIYGVDMSRQVYKNHSGLVLPVFKTEDNINYAFGDGTDPRTQKMLGAVYAALSIRTLILKNVSYRVQFHFASSKTAEQKKSTGGFGLGMINLDNNQPWYPYYVHLMIGPNLAVGDSIVESSSNVIKSLTWFHNGKLNILLIHNSTGSKTISLQGVTGQFNYQKIDDPTGLNYNISPSVQIGVVNAEDTINLNNYTVMLLQSSTTPTSTTTTIRSTTTTTISTTTTIPFSNCDSKCKTIGYSSGICRTSNSVLPFPTSFNLISNPRDGTGGKSFHTHNNLVTMFKTLYDKYTGYASYEPIGKTYEGRDIVLFKIGNPNGGKVLWDGSIHGWEDVGSEVEYLIAKWLLENGTTGIDSTAQKIIQQNLILFVPVINMDSYERQNLNKTSCTYGVDLNRNFLTGWPNPPTCNNMNYPGSSAASEKETQAMRNVFKTYKPDFYLNTHYGGGLYMSSSGSTPLSSGSTLEAQLIQSIRQISTQRGVTPYSMSVGGSAGSGMAYGDAKQLGVKSSWLIELNKDNSTLAGTTVTHCHCWGHGCDTYQDVVNIAYPRMLPIFIAMANASAVISQAFCQSGETSIGQDGCSSGQNCCCGSPSSTTTTIPSGFNGNNFACNYVQTNNLWGCSLNYTNNLGENGKVKFHFIDSLTSEVKSTGTVWTNIDSSGTVGSELSCNSYHGTYNVVWRTYRSSDTSYSNPVAMSTSFKTITC